MQKLNPKLIGAVVLLLLVAGGAYKFLLAAPADAESKEKVHGQVYPLPKEFLVNLADGRFAKLSVGLVLDHDEYAEATSAGGHGSAPPEGFGDLPQEAVVRDVIVDELTDVRDADLIDGTARGRLKREIRRSLNKHTDVHVSDVLFTDVTVQ